LLEETPLVEWNQLLQDAIKKLSQGKVESAISSIAEARKGLMTDVSLAVIGSNEYQAMRQIARLMQCAMLHYWALARKEQLKGNDALTLTYLGHSLGVNATLDSILPLMEKTTERNYTKNETLWFSKLNSAVREILCKSVTEIMTKNQGKEKAELTRDIEHAVAEIINSVDPNVTSLRELAIDLVRKFEAGDFKLRAGDCEDQAILLGSLLSAVGFESAMIFADTDNDGVPDHVYSAVHIPEAPDYTKSFKHKKLDDGKSLHDWIPLDPASQDSDFGVIPIQNLEIVKFVQVPVRKR